jgi:DNA-binding transcriptional MerR regulator
MRIGDLAEAAGVSVRALRYYEEKGLLTSERNSGGQRMFVEGDVRRVRFLQSLYAVGMPSRAIAEMLPCVDHPSAEHSEQAWALMAKQRDRVDADIAELTRTRDQLDRLLAEHSRSLRESLPA